MTNKSLPDPEFLRKCLRYEAETGQIFWVERLSNASKVGSAAFCQKRKDGYLHGQILGKKHLAHRIAWAIHYGYWPENDIDHINRDRSDNSLSNLREATRSENCGNASAKSTNKSGFKGVHLSHGKWIASITVCGVTTKLGYYETPEEAHEAYGRAADKHFGQFARTE